MNVTMDGEAIIVDKQRRPNYRVCLRLEMPSRSIRIERQVVIGPGNEKRNVTERLVSELAEAGDEVQVEHPQQGPMTVADVSKYALLPIVTTLEKIISHE